MRGHDILLFGVKRGQLVYIHLPEPPWPWYFEWVENAPDHTPASFDLFLHVRRIEHPDITELSMPEMMQ
jgi:hypothetical protein